MRSERDREELTACGPEGMDPPKGPGDAHPRSMLISDAGNLGQGDPPDATRVSGKAELTMSEARGTRGQEAAGQGCPSGARPEERRGAEQRPPPSPGRCPPADTGGGPDGGRSVPGEARRGEEGAAVK